MSETKPSIPLARPLIPEASIEAASRCMRSGWIGYGPECHALEREFIADRGGWALATTSCTSALHIAATLCRQGQQDEIIAPPITFVSSAMAFACAGFKLRFAEVDPVTLMPTADTVMKKITPHTRAVLAVHLYGQRAPVEELRELCDRHGIMLIEDCAHRIDLPDAPPRVADFSCFSFNAMKEIPCGEGGMLWGRDSGHESPARAISNAGLDVDTWQRSATARHADYQFSEWTGLKLRLNDILAAVVRAALPSLHGHRARRRDIFLRYNEALQKLSPAINPPPLVDGHSCLMYVLQINGAGRDAFRAHLAGAGIASSVHYPSLSRHMALNHYNDRCPVAEKLCEQIVTLPCHLNLLADEQQRVAETIAKIITMDEKPNRLR